MRFTPLVLVCAAACGAEGPRGSGIVEVDLPPVLDTDGVGRVDLELVAPAVVRVNLAGQQLFIEAVLGEQWVRPRLVSEPTIDLDVTGEGPVAVTVWSRGRALPELRRERSLIWLSSALLDLPAYVGLGKVMAAAAADGHGGIMLDAWFR